MLYHSNHALLLAAAKRTCAQGPCMCLQLQELEAVLYAMPETSGAAPKPFTDLDICNKSDDVIGQALHHTRAVPCIDLD